MRTREALLQAIADDPTDDELRLIYADWLEEDGDPARAEFIRVQIELASLPWPSERATVLSARAQALQHEHGQRWKEELPPAFRDFTAYDRGFPMDFARYSFPRDDWEPPLAEDIEWFTTTNAGYWSNAVVDLWRAAVLQGGVSGLRIRNFAGGHQWEDPWLPPLLASPEASLLRGLDLPCASGERANHLPGVVSLLAEAPALANLRVLVLRGASVEAVHLAALTSSPHLAGLRVLVASQDAYAGGQRVPAEAFTDARCVGLRYLAFVGNYYLDAPAALALLTSPLAALERVTIGIDGDVGIPLQAALYQRFGAGLQIVLDLAQVTAGARALARVCRRPGDPGPRLAFAECLARIEADHDPGPPDVRLPSYRASEFQFWAAGDRAEAIRLHVQLAEMPVGEVGRRALDERAEALRVGIWLPEDTNENQWRAELPILPGITWGAVEGGFVTGLRADTVATLVCWLETATWLTPIEHVQVAARSLSAAAVRSFADLAGFRHVHTLTLRTRHLSLAAARLLIEAPALANLHTLDLPGCQLAAGCEPLLRSRFPVVTGSGPK